MSPPQEAKLHFLDYWRIIRIRKTVILAVFLLVVITATVVTFILQELFVGTARINVQKESTDIGSVTPGQNYNPGGVDPYFIQTEYEVMQSQVLLSKVVENPKLNLNERWAAKNQRSEPLKTADSIVLLKQNLELRPIRNTSLIEIRYYSDRPEEAAEIANAIADAYKDYRLDRNKDKMEQGIKALKQEMDKQEKELHVAQTNVDWLRQELHVSDSDPQSPGPVPTFSSAIISQIQGNVVNLEGDAARLETQLTKLHSLPKEKLRGTIQTVVEPDSLLSTFLTELDIAEQSLLRMQKTMTENHPDYTNAVYQVEKLNDKIDERVENLMIGLQTRLDSAKAMISSQTNRLAEARQTDIEIAAYTRPYWEAKLKLQEQLNFRSILQMKIASEEADLKLPKDTMVEVIDRQITPNMRPVKPNKTLNITLGVVIGLIVGIGLAFFIEYLDTSVKTIDDVERTLQAPVLGVIPQNVGFLLDEGAESPHAEAYRVLRTNLLFSRKEDKLNTIAVVSAGAGEGKSTTVFNLAAVFAQNGSRVVIVDSDLRRPTLHKMLGITNSLGLTNYLLKQNSLEEVIQTTSLPTLDFMASGKLPSSSLGILSSSQMKELITELKRRYDFVFFDSPPIMGVSDASILASEVDMTLQVIQYRRYPQPMNIRAKQMIEKVGGNLVGIVLNNINVSQDENYYYYSGYYNEYYSKNEEEAETGTGDKTKPDIKPKY